MHHFRMDFEASLRSDREVVAVAAVVENCRRGFPSVAAVVDYCQRVLLKRAAAVGFGC